MKEYQSTLGGRPLYSSDIKNLQELALSFTELFKDYNAAFVLTGCHVTSQNNAYQLSEGYVFLDGKIRHVDAASVASVQNLKIVSMQRNGGSITYNDVTDHVQYIEYYAEYQNSDVVTSPHISYNGAWPSLRTTFMNYYAVVKNVPNQSVQDLSLNDFLNVGGIATFGKEIHLPNGFVITTESDGICFTTDKLKKSGSVFKIGNDNKIYYATKGNDTYLQLFCEVTENEVGDLVLNFENISTNNLEVKQKSSGYVGIPIGGVQIFAGKANKIPDDFLLCNGQRVKKSEYPKLYDVIGDTYNKYEDYNGVAVTAPPTGYFRVPDLRGRFIAGYDDDKTWKALLYDIGKYGGEESHKLSVAEMPKHRHVYTDDTNAEGAYGSVEPGFPIRYLQAGGKTSGSDRGSGTIYWTSTQGADAAHENRPPFYVMAYIIRAK